VLRDVVCPKSDRDVMLHLLGRLLGLWRRQGLSWASLEASSPALDRCYKEAGCVPVPSNGNRYYVHADPPLAMATCDDWFRSGLDGDYFDTRW
jgi:hypothetical protein